MIGWIACGFGERKIQAGALLRLWNSNIAPRDPVKKKTEPYKFHSGFGLLNAVLGNREGELLKDVYRNLGFSMWPRAVSN